MRQLDKLLDRWQHVNEQIEVFKLYVNVFLTCHVMQSVSIWLCPHASALRISASSFHDEMRPAHREYIQQSTQ
jgi:hypothetical protein